jgi:hypothetical protein
VQSNAAQRETHIRRRNRKRFDSAVGFVRSVAAAIRALADLSMTLSLLCRYLPEPAGASVMAIAFEMKI